jgi:small subunit ribosomal protein S13
MAAVRIAGVTLPANKRVEIALTYIYGIGTTRAKSIVAEAKVDTNVRVANMTDADISAVRQTLEKHFKVEGDLKREVLLNIKRLKEISAYRGVRHSRNLPTRGQRTKTNSRTVRGNVRRTMGSGRKSAAEKT